MSVEFIARLLLGLLFVAAGAGKLRRPDLTRAMLRDFGVRPRAIGPAALGLPLAELACASLLFVGPAARIGAGVAVILLTVFTVAIGHVLRTGQSVQCNCFGAVGSAPVTRLTLIRNLVLGSGGVLVLVAGAGRVPVVSLTGDQVLILSVAAGLLALIAAHVFFSYELYRQNARLLARINALEDDAGRSQPAPPAAGLPTGAAAPAFTLTDLSGERTSLDSLLSRGAPVALAFLDPNCGACGPILPRLAELRDRDDDLTVAVVTSGDREAARQRVNGYHFDAVLIQEDHEVLTAYRVVHVPSLQLVSSDGRVDGPLAVGPEAIKRRLALAPPLDIQLIRAGG